VIQVAYYYVSEIQVLNLVYLILLVLAFLFFYRQATLTAEQGMHTLNEPEAEMEAEV